MNTLRLVIGNKNYSSWSLRGWLVLVKLGLEFEEIRVPLGVEGYRRRLLEYSPAGKVPVLIDGDIVVWDSLAIIEYLAQRHPELWPDSPAQAAHARSIAAEMHAGFAALRTAMPMNCRAEGRRVEITAAVAADIARIQEIWSTCRRDSREQGSWLFGRFSAADAMFVPVVSRFHTYGVECAGLAREYMGAVLADPDIWRWYVEAHKERETIARLEQGLPGGVAE